MFFGMSRLISIFFHLKLFWSMSYKVLRIFFILPFVMQFLVTEAIIPQYLPVFQAVNRNDAIQKYFTLAWIQGLGNSYFSSQCS